MSNYQYENSNINQFMTNLLWGLFIIHAKLQIWFGKVYDNFFYPVYMSLEKILGLDDETYYDNDDVAINTVVKSSVKFLSVMLQYKENEVKRHENVLDMSVNADKIYQNDSLFVDNFNINSITEKDSMLTNMAWKNNIETAKNEASFTIETVFNGYRKTSSEVRDVSPRSMVTPSKVTTPAEMLAS